MTKTVAKSLLITHLSILPDPRKEINRKHLLIDILMITVCAVMAGAHGWEDIENWGIEKEEWLRKFLKLPFGIPCHDVFRDLFMRLHPEAFGEAFLSWMSAVRKRTKGEVIPLDGKTIRRSMDRASGKTPFHLVSAWAADNGLVLGQMAVDGKSNEITAIPKLLELLDINDCIVTIDAMGCQTEIAKKIVDLKGDYVLAVKDNQPKLHEELKDFFDFAEKVKFADLKYEVFQTVEKDHGRMETRTYYLVADLDWLGVRSKWANLNSVGMVVSNRQEKGKPATEERRYYINTIENGVRRFAKAVRSHWHIESKLHWTLDVTFNEDQSRKRKDHSAVNFALILKAVINLLRGIQSKGDSIRSLRLRAGWNTEIIEKAVFGA
jgi:predicted transposase YbfD/YdcC